MRTVTLSRLRHDLGSILACVKAGETVEISKRGRIIAMLLPPPAPKLAGSRKRPDFVGRMKRIYGGKVLRGNIVVEERESRHY